MASVALPPMLGDPCHVASSSTFFRDQGKLSRGRRERLNGLTSSAASLPGSSPVSPTKSQMSRSVSMSQIKSQSRSTVALPPIMKARRALSFEDMYAAARLRVAKKAAKERQGGLAPHLSHGPQLPDFPSGCNSKWSIGSFDPFSLEASQTQQWAAAVMDLVQDEQASKVSAEDVDEGAAETGSVLRSLEAAGGAGEAGAAPERANSRQAPSSAGGDSRPPGSSAGAQARMDRLKARASVGDLAETGAGSFETLDPGLAELLVALSARYAGETEGLSEQEIARLRSAFDRFKMPGESEMYTEDLQGLLNYLGHVLTTKEAIGNVVREVTMYDYIDFNEFISFMEKFHEYERAEFRAKFEEYEADENGEISLQDLRDLTNALGFHPLLRMTQEAVNVVHNGESGGRFSFDEVCLFLAVYGYNEGFTTEETADLRRQFDHFSEDNQGPLKNQRLLPPANLSDALVQFFGLEVQEFTVRLGEQLASGQGLQKSSFDRGAGEPESINFSEFKIMARKIREQDHRYVKEKHGDFFSRQEAKEGDLKFDDVDLDHSGGISEKELRKVLKARHYTPLRSVLDEVFEDVYDGDWDPDESELDFDELFDFLSVFNRRDGFTRAELEELRNTYDRFDEDKSGEVSAMEIAALFRHVGYRVNLEDIRDEVAEVDANGSGQLDFREFLRLMRLYREKELARVKAAFHSSKDSATNLVPLRLLEKVLKGLGHEPPYPEFFQEDLSFDELVDLVDSCRSAFVAKERKKAGFSDMELEQFEELFRKFDKDKSETIDNRELQGILKEFGWEPRTREEQQALITKLDMARRLAREAGADDLMPDGSPCVKFWSFVQLVRMLRTEQDKAEEEELAAVQKELSFSEGETEEFRQVFRTWVKKARELAGEKPLETKGGQAPPETISRDGIHRLIRSLGLPVTDDKKEILDAKITNLDPEGRFETAKLNFCAFLRLMRWILDTDFAGVNDVAAATSRTGTGTG